MTTPPCSTCHAECCGPVPLSPQRLKMINRFVAKIDTYEISRLAAQKRGELNCGFLDKENHRCAIYPVRPELCQIYGMTEDLQCPHSTELITTITPAGANIRIHRDKGTGPLQLSTDWTWKEN